MIHFFLNDPLHHSTVGQIKQEPRREYWATRLSVRLFARTTHSFACSALLTLLVHKHHSLFVRSHHSLDRSLAHFTHSLTRGKVND